MLRILESGVNDFSDIESSPVGSALASCGVADGFLLMTVPLKHVAGRVRSRSLGSCT